MSMPSSDIMRCDAIASGLFCVIVVMMMSLSGILAVGTENGQDKAPFKCQGQPSETGPEPANTSVGSSDAFVTVATDSRFTPTNFHFSHIKTYASNYGDTDIIEKQWVKDHFDLTCSGEKITDQNLLYVSWSHLCQTDENYTILYDHCDANGVDFEDMFYHYARDVNFTEATLLSQHQIQREGRFFKVWVYDGSIYKDRTYDAFGDGYALPSQLPKYYNTSFCSKAGDVLYVGKEFRFREVHFNLSQFASGGWDAAWEYWDGTSWSALTVTDSTSKMSTNGSVGFAPPSDWNMNAVNGSKCYWARLRCTAGGTAGPQAQSIEKVWAWNDWIGISGIRCENYVIDGKGKRIIPGWNESNDPDGNGYVDDTEFASLADPNATARLKYMSRAPSIYWTNGWVMNFNNTLYQAFAINRSSIAMVMAKQDGIFHDNCWKALPSVTFGKGTYIERLDPVKDYHQNIVNYLHAFKSKFTDSIVIINAYIMKEVFDYVEQVDGTMGESIIHSASSLKSDTPEQIASLYADIKYLSDRGKALIVHSNNRGVTSTDRDNMYSLAKYYLMATNCTYFKYQDTAVNGYDYPWRDWFDAIEWDVGQPTNEYYIERNFSTIDEYPTPPPINILKNPSFEMDADSNGIPDNWMIENWAGTVYGKRDTVAKAGLYSIKIFATSGVNYGGAYQYVTVKPYTNYTLSCWIKTQDLRSTDMYGAQVYFNTGPGTSKGDKIVGVGPGTHDWTYVSTIVRTGNNTAGSYVYAGQIANGNGTVWFDDVRLEEGAYQYPYNVYVRTFTKAKVLLKPAQYIGFYPSTDNTTATTYELDDIYFPLRPNGTLGPPAHNVSLRYLDGAVMIPLAAALDSIEVLPADTTMTSDETRQFSAVAHAKGYTLPLDVLSWEVSGGGSIDQNGNFNASKVGVWKVFANWSGFSGNTTITVTPGQLKNITVFPNQWMMTTDEYRIFTASGTDGDLNPVPFTPVWAASGGGSIDQYGNYTGDRPGLWIIYANASGVCGRADVNVSEGALELITVSPNQTSITTDQSVNFTASAFDSDNNPLDVSFFWSISGGGAIDQSGNFTANKPGEWTVRAEAFGKNGTATVTVIIGALTKILVEPGTIEMTTDEYIKFEALGYDADDNKVSISPVWSVSGGGTIDTSGNFSAVRPGNWTIYANASSISGTAFVSIAPGKVSTITISPSFWEFNISESILFTTKCMDADGNELSPDIEWAVSGGGTIDQYGRFTAKEPGTWTVFANMSGITGTALVLVKANGTNGSDDDHGGLAGYWLFVEIGAVIILVIIAVVIAVLARRSSKESEEETAEEEAMPLSEDQPGAQGPAPSDEPGPANGPMDKKATEAPGAADEPPEKGTGVPEGPLMGQVGPEIEEAYLPGEGGPEQPPVTEEIGTTGVESEQRSEIGPGTKVEDFPEELDLVDLGDLELDSEAEPEDQSSKDGSMVERRNK